MKLVNRECMYRCSSSIDSNFHNDMRYTRGMSAKENRVPASIYPGYHIFLFYFSNNLPPASTYSVRVFASSFRGEFILRTILYKNPITGNPDIVRAIRAIASIALIFFVLPANTDNKKKKKKKSKPPRL